MDNLEYLKKIRKFDEEVENDIYKNKNKDYPLNVEWAQEAEINFRKVKALEIIAESIINLDTTLACLVPTLENIETTIKQR